MRTPAVPSLFTPGRIADELGVSLPRVLYVLATRRHIVPVARAGTLRLYDREAVARIRHELNAIDARRNGQGRPMNEHAPTVDPIVPELLTTAEAARLLGIGERTFWRHSRSGAAPAAVRIGGAVRYRRSELLEWVKNGCQRVDSPAWKGGAR